MNDTLCEDYGSNYSRRALAIAGVLTTILVMLGIAANVINARIFLDRQMRASLVNWYLAGLSISDFLVVSCSFFIISFPVYAEINDRWAIISASRRAIHIAYPLALIAQTESIFLTVSVATYRFIGVCFPFHAPRLCTQSNVVACLIAVSIFAIVYNIPRFFEVELFECIIMNEVEGRVEIFHDMRQTWLRQNEQYKFHYIGWIYIVVMFVVPFTILITVNACTIRAVRESMHQREIIAKASVSRQRSMRRELPRRATRPGQSPDIEKPLIRKPASRPNVSPSTPSPKETGTTIMLVGIVFAFLICNSLAFINNIIEIGFLRQSAASVSLQHAYSSMVDVSNFLVTLNSVANIVIYTSFSRNYRKVLFRLCRCRLDNGGATVNTTTVGGVSKSYNALVTNGRTSSNDFGRSPSSRRMTKACSDYTLQVDEEAAVELVPRQLRSSLGVPRTAAYEAVAVSNCDVQGQTCMDGADSEIETRTVDRLYVA